MFVCIIASEQKLVVCVSDGMILVSYDYIFVCLFGKEMQRETDDTVKTLTNDATERERGIEKGGQIEQRDRAKNTTLLWDGVEKIQQTDEVEKENLNQSLDRRLNTMPTYFMCYTLQRWFRHDFFFGEEPLTAHTTLHYGTQIIELSKLNIQETLLNNAYVTLEIYQYFIV